MSAWWHGFVVGLPAGFVVCTVAVILDARLRNRSWWQG
jgi:hypothetical protein